MNYKLVRSFSILTLCIKTSDLSKALFMSSYAGSVIGLKKEVHTLDFTNTYYSKRRHSQKDNYNLCFFFSIRKYLPSPYLSSSLSEIKVPKFVTEKEIKCRQSYLSKF